MEYILGVLVSIIVEVVKRYVKSSTLGTYLILLGISIVGAAAYYYLSHSAYWNTLIEILTIAAAFHNLIIRRLTNQNSGN